MMDIEHERQNQLEDIIVNKRITPVFQPIVISRLSAKDTNAS